MVRWLALKAQSRLDDYLVGLTRCQRKPRPLDGLTGWAAEQSRLALQLYLEGLHGRVQVWQGQAESAPITIGQMRVAYLGDDRAYRVHSPQYLQHILFPQGEVSVTERGRYAVVAARTAAQAAAAEASADLVIVEGNELLRWRPNAGRWVWCPTWVRMVVNLAGRTWDEIEKPMHAHKRNYKIAKNGCFRAAISHREADFDFFYERMYAPTTAARHAGYGLLDSREGMRWQFQHGLLLLAYPAEGAAPDVDSSQPAAGMLVYLCGGAAFGIASGVLDGDCRWYDAGGLSTVYYRGIQWAYQNGLDHFDVGGVRPFVNDGLYIYKSRWGFRPTHDLWLGRGWLFWSPHNSPAALEWLECHPLVKVE